MSFGRRGGAPASPPIPMPAPPPAAYGIAVPGAPAVPLMPPPPAVPQPPMPQQYAPPQQYAAPQQYAPPVPQAAPPSDLSGFFGGPAAPPPPSFGGPSQFGGPAPSQFGGPPQFGAPARPGMEYGAPAWSAAPAKKSSNRLLLRVGVSLVVFLTIGGGGRWVFDNLNKQHVGTLPVMLGDYALDTSPQAQAVIQQTMDKLSQDPDSDQLKHFQLGVYRSGESIVVADMADTPATSGADRGRMLDSFAGGAGLASFDPVAPGHQGGSESCGATTNAEVCAWVDDGTVGAVFIPGGDTATAQFYLQKLRDSAES